MIKFNINKIRINNIKHHKENLNSNLRKRAKTLWILKNFKIIKIWKIMKTYNIKNMMIFKIKILNKLKINKISKIIIIEINF